MTTNRGAAIQAIQDQIAKTQDHINTRCATNLTYDTANMSFDELITLCNHVESQRRTVNSWIS